MSHASQFAPVKLTRRLQCIVIPLTGEQIGCACHMPVTCHYVTLQRISFGNGGIDIIVAI